MFLKTFVTDQSKLHVPKMKTTIYFRGQNNIKTMQVLKSGLNRELQPKIYNVGQEGAIRK